jgi:hypothetical protein
MRDRSGRSAFVRSNTEIMGSNPTIDMDVYVYLFYLCCPVCRYQPCDELIPLPRSRSDSA